MTPNGAADAGTPVSRTGETPGKSPAKTPLVVTPLASPAAVTPTAKKQEGSETAVEPAAGAKSPPPIDSGRVEIGGEQEKPAESAPVLSPPIVESQKNDDSPKNLRTAVIKLVDYHQLDEHGEPIKEQERVSYQNMLVRYGDWSNVRCQVLAYFLVTIAACMYKGHYEEISLITAVKSTNGTHAHCCCDRTNKLEELWLLGQEMKLTNVMYTLLIMVLLLAGGLSPLWERFIGRRKVLLSLMIAGVPAAGLIIYAPSFSFPQQLCHYVLGLCGLLTMLITTATLVEMLPYETRFLAVYSFKFAGAITTATAILHVHRGFEFKNLGIMCLIACLAGGLLVKFVIKDSICHLNIRNDVDYLLKQEENLLNVRPEGGRHFHQAVAKKIFEDLVYLDQDELKLAEFFKRLWRNFAMIEIVLAFFQAMSCGLHEYEFNHFTNERFVHPLIHSNDRLVGLAICPLLMFFLRKAHRNRAMCILFAAQLLNSAVRHAFVAYDPANGCGSIHVVKRHFNGFAMVVSAFAVALGYCSQMTILLHFLETAPSILRPTCVLIVYMPIKLMLRYGKNMFTDGASKDLSSLMPIYSYHLIIIIITILRTRSRLPFSLYLFDLMPHNERDRDDRPSHEKIRPMPEESAQPPTANVTITERTTNVTNLDDQTQTTRKERRGKTSEKSRLSFRRALKSMQR